MKPIKAALLVPLILAALSTSGAGQAVGRSPDRPRTPVVPVYPLPQTLGRVPNIGRLPLFSAVERLGTQCVAWSDVNSMRRMGIARGWQLLGAQYRRSFVGLDANGRLRYVMDSMQDLGGPFPDREDVTVQFFGTGKVEVGRRGSWNIGPDAAIALPQVAGLFASDSTRAYAFARSLVRLCADAERR